MLVNLALPVDKPSEDATPGEILLYHRVNRGISHQELADKLGYKRAYGIVDLERGFNPIHIKMQSSLAKFSILVRMNFLMSILDFANLVMVFALQKYERCMV